jgi:hypothetical protein
MSASGHWRTFCDAAVMSAFLPKADMCGATENVRYGPKADIEFDYVRSGSKAATRG